MITEPLQAELRETRATAHSTCVVCGAANRRSLGLKFVAGEDGVVHASFGCDKAFEGYAGMLHGGIIASLLDGAMTNCMFAKGVPAITAELNVRFRHPVVVNEPATVRAWVDRSSPPLYVLKSEIVQGGQLKAVGVGKFIKQPG